MGAWTGVVLAPADPGGDRLGSRLSRYLHPLAGRPLAWHAAACLAGLRPAPDRLLVLNAPELADVFTGLDVPVVPVDRLPRDLPGGVLAVHAAAPTAGQHLQQLIDEGRDALLRGTHGYVLAAFLGADHRDRLATVATLEELRSSSPGLPVASDDEGFIVRTREDLAQASVVIRDRVVRRLMADGVTFLLPDSVLVDAEVRIGRDSVIYPGAVIEGQTRIGEETVVGPGCRIVNSTIGRGVELKGFNYVTHASIRNRAILEAYDRRGFD